MLADLVAPHPASALALKLGFTDDEEIAAAMECPVGTVRSRIFRAREAIDKRLREVFEGGLGRTEEMV